MKRRDFSLAAPALAVLSFSVFTPMARAQAFKPTEGADYYVLEKPMGVEAPAGKIEVVEFFWYNCPHCNAFEPLLEAWVKKLPKDVAFRRVPRRFADSDVPQQQLYYALEAMGLVDKLHAKIFAAVHVERKKLDRGEAIVDWIAAQGVDRGKFLDQYNSFSVMTKATKALQLQNSYRVEGVPALGVAGRFYTDGQIAKSMDRALLVVDALVADLRGKRT